MPKIGAGVLKSGPVMLGGVYFARSTIRNAAAENSVSPVFGVHREIRAIMPGRFDELSITAAAPRRNLVTRRVGRVEKSHE